MRVEGFIRQEAIAREREKNRPQRERYQWSDEELERIERSKVRKVMLEFFQDERHRELSSQEYKLSGELFDAQRKGEFEKAARLSNEIKRVRAEQNALSESYGLYYDKKEHRIKLREHRESGRTRERHADHRELLYSW